MAGLFKGTLTEQRIIILEILLTALETSWLLISGTM